MNITLNTNSYNNNNIIKSNINKKPQYRAYQPSFSGKAPQNSKIFEPILKPFKKLYTRATSYMAIGITKLFDNKIAEKYIQKAKNTNLVAHLACTTSLVLSGFYMKQTLQNKKLDKNKRITLAINQGSVAILSGIMAYTLDKMVNKQISRFIDKYKVINPNMKNLSEHLSGIKAAKTIMIFGFIYRYFSPVLVTPIANLIGNKLNSNQNQSKKA